MIFDPLYLIIIGVGFALSLGAQFWTKNRVHKWAEVATERGMSGRDVARAILQAEGINDVGIEQASGFLSDHYDPSSRTLRLSPDIFGGRSVTAAGIAAHEVGHAIQHKQGYLPMTIRQKMVPVANIGTNLGVWIMIIGLVIGVTSLAQIGVWLFGGFVAFTLVTLPVEFDASSRAKAALERHGLLSQREMNGVSQVLTAAAATYVAAAVAAILQLLYWLFRLGVIGGRD
ncbi:MAG: zinc metallopeptidase [Persicimonas sp.]